MNATRFGFVAAASAVCAKRSGSKNSDIILKSDSRSRHCIQLRRLFFSSSKSDANQRDSQSVFATVLAAENDNEFNIMITSTSSLTPLPIYGTTNVLNVSSFAHQTSNQRYATNTARNGKLFAAPQLADSNELFAENWPIASQIKKEVDDDFDFSSLCNGLIGSETMDARIKCEDSITPQMSASNAIGACGIGSGGQQYPLFAKEIEDLTFNLCAKEIDVACEELGISADPFNWNSQDVRSWLMWQICRHNLPMFALEYFQMDGMTLCTLKEHDFQQRAPECGETLYVLLEIWKTAANLAPQTCPSSLRSFKPEETIIELNAFLDQWNGNGNEPSNGIASQQQQQSASASPSSAYCSSQSSPCPSSSSPTSTASLEYSFECLSPCTPCSSPQSTVSDTTMICVDKSKLNSVDIAAVTSDYGSEGTQSDDEISEDGCEVSSPSSGQQASVTSTGGRASGSHIHLWQFLKELLSQPQEYGSCIRWTDRQKGIFKIEDSVRVARLWGKRKNRPAMNYDKLSRSIRQYYKKGIMKKTERSQRLVYQFCHPYCL